MFRLLAILIAVLSFFCYKYFVNNSSIDQEFIRKSHVLDAMLKEESKFSVNNLRVAVGYGACQDLFVKGSEVLGNMSPPSETNHYGKIDTLDELKEMYALFFSSGSAAERYCSNETLFEQLVKEADLASSSYYKLGGNAPVIASRFAKEGAKVLLAAREDQYLMEEIMPNIQVTGKSQKDHHSKDIHVIFEYVTGEKWGDYQSPRANRFIVHSDDSNPTVSTAEEFHKQIKSFDPHLLVISGLQMMDNFPFHEGEREQRLKVIQEQMIAQPAHTRIHFEMASFTDKDLLGNLLDMIVPYADSLGMNEQELPNLYSMSKFQNISLVSDFNPRIATVLDQMREVYSLLNSQRKNGVGRPLTRLHVHTLAFQAIMTHKSSPWKLNKAAATKASLTANRHVCNNTDINVNKSYLLMDDGFSLSESKNSKRIHFKQDDPVACWEEQDNTIEICIAPTLVCTKAQQTAGGGDNISAAGLVLQI